MATFSSMVLVWLPEIGVTTGQYKISKLKKETYIVQGSGKYDVASMVESSTRRVAGLDDLGVVEQVLNMTRVNRSAPPQVANNDVSIFCFYSSNFSKIFFLPQSIFKNREKF